MSPRKVRQSITSANETALPAVRAVKTVRAVAVVYQPSCKIQIWVRMRAGEASLRPGRGGRRSLAIQFSFNGRCQVRLVPAIDMSGSCINFYIVCQKFVISSLLSIVLSCRACGAGMSEIRYLAVRPTFIAYAVAVDAIRDECLTKDCPCRMLRGHGFSKESDG